MNRNPLYTLAHGIALALLIAALLPLGALSARAQEGIDAEALYHDSRDDLYRTPGGAAPFGSAVTLRLRAATGNLDSATVRVFNTLRDRQDLVPMVVAATTPDGYDLWEATIEVGDAPTILWYRFIVTRGGQTVYYEDDQRLDGDGAYLAENEGGPGAVYTQSPDLSYQITVYDPAFSTPEWMRNAVVYQIFPDRFRNGDPANDPSDGSATFYGALPLIFHETWNEPPVDPRQPGEFNEIWGSDFFGGDLAGITEKLDYLADLGVTALYLNPIFAARSNHRYDTADFLAIDPLLGTRADFDTLIAEADARGMKVILDGVFNHMSSDSAFFDRYNRFPAVVGACESEDSEWRDWFFFVEPQGPQPALCVGDESFYVSWAGYDSIPKLDNANAEVRDYFFAGEGSVARTWGEAGIGGWRLDVGGDIDPGGPANDYWERFREVVREVNPEAVIIGEEWQDASRWLGGAEWDAVMNYRLRRGILGFARDAIFTDNDANGDNTIRPLGPGQLDALIESIAEDYPPQAYHAMMNLLGSHDTSRVFFVVGDDPARLKLAALVQFTLPGAPAVYYGDEIALDAPSQPDSGGNLQDDPYNRAPYPWPDAEGDAYRRDEDMLAFYRQLGALRNEHPALREGERITLRADDEAGVLAYLRRDATAGDAALVVINQSETEQMVSLELAGLVPDGLTLEPTFGGAPITVGAEPVSMTIPALGGEIWAGTALAPFSALEAPANLSAEGAPGAVSLAWDAVPDASGYRVYRSPVASGGFEPVTGEPVIEAAYVDDAVTNGYRYYYAVAAVGADGLPGALSEPVAVTPSATIAETFYVRQGARLDAAEPLSLVLEAGTLAEVSAAIRIEGVTEADGPAEGVRAQAALVPEGADLEAAAWQPMTYAGELDGADVYRAEFQPNAAQAYQGVARFSTDAGETWQIVTLPATLYPPLTVTRGDDATAPDAPAAVRVPRATTAGVQVEWDASPSEDVAFYRVYRTVRGQEQMLLAEIPAGGDNRFTDTDATLRKRHTYAVSAVDAAYNESGQTTAEEVVIERPVVSVTFNVTVPEATDTGEGDVYIAGSFGDDYPNWDPAGLVMTQVDPTHWTITLELGEGASAEYKYVRGTWDAVEKGPACEEIANRRLKVTLPPGASDLTVEDTVAKWRDLDNCG